MLLTRKFKSVYVIYFFVLVLFLYQDAIGNIFSVFNLFDELESLVCLFVLFYRFAIIDKFSINKRYFKLIKYWFYFLLITFIGNIFSSYQSLPFVFFDIFTFSKFLINILIGYFLFSKKRIKEIVSVLLLIAKISTVLIFLFAVHDTFFTPFFPYLSDRYNTRSLMLFFSNQTYLAQISVILVIIHFIYTKNKRNRNTYIFLCSLIAISTFRTKVLGWLVLALFIIYFIYKFHITHFLIFSVFGGLGAIAIGWTFIDRYFISGADSSVRFLILAGGIALANVYFPFGSGFGTFCSAASTINMTPAYDRAAGIIKSRIKTIFNVSTMIKNGPVHDMFWAMLIGQSGYSGTLFFLFFLFAFYKLVGKMIKKYSKQWWGIILIFLYLVIASIGETSFTSFYVIDFGLLIGFILKDSEVKN